MIKIYFSFEVNSFIFTNSTTKNDIPNLLKEVNKQIDHNNLKKWNFAF